MIEQAYLGGPMRGVEKQNEPAFKAGAKDLRGRGIKIISPIEHEDDIGFDYVSDIYTVCPESLAWDLAQIARPDVDAVIFLPGWEKSEGSKLERHFAHVLSKPVYFYRGEDRELELERVGDPRFHALLEEIGLLHDRKQMDYGSKIDPFANVRASEEWGIPGWVGGLMRLNDKVHRLKQFAQRGVLANESAEDSMLDIAVYALISLVLYREVSA